MSSHRFGSDLEGRIWDLLDSGLRVTDIADVTGRSMSAIQAYLMRHNYRRPKPPAVWTDRFLSMPEREEISRGLSAGLSFRKIAIRLGRAPSTVSREVNVNGGRDNYRAVTAEQSIRERVKRPKVTKLGNDFSLRRIVELLLVKKWSPQQISGRLKLIYPEEPEMWVSHETIYKSLYKNYYGVLGVDHWRYLRTKRRGRKPRRHMPRRGIGVLKGYNSVHDRPEEIELKQTLGHWEGDLVVGGKSTVVATLVERKTKYLKLAKMEGRSADDLADAIAKTYRNLPKKLRGSLTWDQGKEIAGHKKIEKQTKMDVYVCDPRSPWQRGLNENTNGLIREYLPRGTNLKSISQKELNKIAYKLNTRPRKTLEFMTPEECFKEEMSV